MCGPVVLTKNGRGRYAVLDRREYGKTQAMFKLRPELAKGEKSGREQGRLTPEEVEASLDIALSKIRYSPEAGIGAVPRNGRSALVYCCHRNQ